MRRGLSVFLCAILFCLVFLPLVPVTSHAANEPTRVINVVYDDSGSMYVDDAGNPLDTWRQAKYALEVFAALLGPNDTMYVYFMGDYDYQNGNSAPARLTLRGSDGAEANVRQIHEETTLDTGTPFNAVRKAYTDLAATSADERWLVVLTDGVLADGIGSDGYPMAMNPQEVSAFFADKDPGISVMYLAMGPEAMGISGDDANNIFCEIAPRNADILHKITGISTRIFNSNSFSVDASSRSFSVDVPMSELVVFAQGANVRINSLDYSGEGGTQSFTGPSVEVHYSELDNSRYSSLRYAVDESLQGRLATFTGDMPAGDYSIDIGGGAETIEVFYKPNIDIAAYLRDADGNEVTDLSELEAGDYTITFGFVSKTTGEPVPASSLLGNVDYNATVTMNGNTVAVRSGDQVTIEEGSLVIDAEATFLDYNGVHTTLTRDVFANKTITFRIGDNPQYRIVSDGIENGSDTIAVEALIDGQTPTPEQWSQMALPTVQYTDTDREFDPGELVVEKSDQPGVYLVHPVLTDGRPSSGTYSDSDFTIDYEQTVDSSNWRGQGQGSVRFQDTRSWFERNWQKIVKFGIIGLIAVIAIGYLPFVKCYLPKGLKAKPQIRCRSSVPGVAARNLGGKFEKNLASTILPYVPQTGKIKYVPKGIAGAPLMEVKAIRDSMMTLTNMKAFINKPDITFNGQKITKAVIESKKFPMGASVIIKAKIGEWTYTCTPNQKFSG